MVPLIFFRQLSVNDELADFEFTFTVKPESRNNQKITASDLQEIRLHYKEDLYNKEGVFQNLHYVQMVLDADDIAVFSEFKGKLPKT